MRSEVSAILKRISKIGLRPGSRGGLDCFDDLVERRVLVSVGVETEFTDALKQGRENLDCRKVRVRSGRALMKKPIKPSVSG